VPTFIYSYEYYTEQLHRTSLVTGEHSSHQVPSYTFKPGCCWSEVPGGSLIITGGEEEYWIGVKEVVRIDTRREFAVSHCPPMLTPRAYHAAVYHTHLYVLGGCESITLGECERYILRGCESITLRECERYLCAENRWEALPPLPRACYSTSGVVLENSLYALGGENDEIVLDLVQKLRLNSLTWELMQFRLPFVGSGIPCFKLRETEVFLVVKKTLYCFTAFEVRPLKALTADIQSDFGPSYYRRGTLYCSNSRGEVRNLEIGSLSH
jgi:hypothetical protein